MVRQILAKDSKVILFWKQNIHSGPFGSPHHISRVIPYLKFCSQILIISADGTLDAWQSALLAVALFRCRDRSVWPATVLILGEREQPGEL